MKIVLEAEASNQGGTLVITDGEGRVVTYSKDQAAQKKVAMITLGELSGYPKIQLAKAFGYSTRKSYYDIRHAVLNGLSADLIPKPTGPQKATKSTRELEILAIQMRYETGLNMYEIAEKLNQSGFDVSARLVGQVLADYGLNKKNLDKNSCSTQAFGKRRNRKI